MRTRLAAAATVVVASATFSIGASASGGTLAFDTTIVANTGLGRPEASIEEVEAGARQAQLLPFVRKLPDGFPIVILDESTANLDEATAAALM